MSRKYFIRVRKEYVGYYEVEADTLREAEWKAEGFLREETDDEVCPSVDFEEFDPKDFASEEMVEAQMTFKGSH